MYWITKAYGVNDEVLSEIDWGILGMSFNTIARIWI